MSGQACSGWTRPRRTRSWNWARMTSARSIWSQAAAKFSPIGPSSVPRLLAYFSSLAACGWFGVVAGAGVLAQFDPEDRCGWLRFR